MSEVFPLRVSTMERIWKKCAFQFTVSFAVHLMNCLTLAEVYVENHETEIVTSACRKPRFTGQYILCP